MVMKCVCTHSDEDQANNAAELLESNGCETEVKELNSGKWGVWADGKLSTRTITEKF